MKKNSLVMKNVFNVLTSHCSFRLTSVQTVFQFLTAVNTITEDSAQYPIHSSD